MSVFKDAALQYAKLGLPVFPLAEKQKVPAVQGGCKAATLDLEQIELAWEHRPNMNIGIATGNGIAVIDIDVDDSKGEDGMEALREWEISHGDLPETVTAITGRGGYHMFYRIQEPVSCSTNAELGIDIRGDGGYIVAPPSIHPNGTTYQWENDPSEYEIAWADDNVMAFIRHVQPNNTRKERFKLPEEIKSGGRNDTLMRYAASLQSRGESDALILASLEAANKICCKPPLPDSEIQSIVDSVVGKYAKGNARKPEPTSGNVALMLKPNGMPMQTIENCGRVLANDSQLAGRFYYDLRGYTRMVSLPLPWDDGTGDRAVNDADYCGLAAYLECEYGLMSKQKAIDAVINVSMQNKRNPVAEWLDSLTWDGTERMDTLLMCFLGCEPTDYNMAVMRLFMFGAIARAYHPGTKFDYMPVLIGQQGIGKSMFLRRLGVRSEWYCDNFNTITGDDAAEKLRGLWIAEMAELLATKKQKDVEGVKAFLTSTVDTIRPKYARETEQRPRACVFCGTTNDAAFLTDSTGNRRFLPIECGVNKAPMSLFDKGTEKYFEQAWAEAVYKFKENKPTLVLDDSLQVYALEKQEQYTEDDPRIGMIQAYLDNKLECAKQVAERKRECLVANDVRVCVQELIEEALPEAYAKQASRFLINEVHKIMQNQIIGWQKYPKSKGKALCGDYGVQRCYVPES